MRLTENKVINRLYWKEDNINNSKWVIWDKQRLWINRLITSEYLTYNIHDEITRE